MNILVTAPPSEAVVSLEEAKVQLRVDHDDDNDYIKSLIDVATSKVDGPRGILGRCLVEQTLEMRLDRFPVGAVALRYPPIIGSVVVKYDDDAGVEQTLSPGLYRLVGNGDAPRLECVNGVSWPSTLSQPEAVRVEYVAGFGSSGDDVPSPIRHAVLLILSDLYENREATSDAPRTELPYSVLSLLAGYRLKYLS